MTIGISIRPTSDHVVVRRDDAEDVTPGGIVLPDASKDTPARGKVVAVGPGRMLDDGIRAGTEVTEGDSVIFRAYAGTEVDIDGDTFVVLQEHDILLVCE